MAALSTPSIGTIILLLLLIPSGFTVNDTAASASCNSSHSKKCHLVRDDVGDYEFMMESEMGWMLSINYDKYKSPPTRIANKQVVKDDCGRPPRYESCLGRKRDTLIQEKCAVYKRGC
ncbi:hypothetical protein Csa_010194 [Cucumis sativus]|uniref:Rapid ALkalinization Factor n=1 Tax=Cucumis sativus TaxID=3659 RepID=A0A0A0LCI8_CUCSA|nr:hypothetical protein Csa_010194 [Cucumis sativus]